MAHRGLRRTCWLSLILMGSSLTAPFAVAQQSQAAAPVATDVVPESGPTPLPAFEWPTRDPETRAGFYDQDSLDAVIRVWQLSQKADATVPELEPRPDLPPISTEEARGGILLRALPTWPGIRSRPNPWFPPIGGILPPPRPIPRPGPRPLPTPDPVEDPSPVPNPGPPPPPPPQDENPPPPPPPPPGIIPPPGPDPIIEPGGIGWGNTIRPGDAFPWEGSVPAGGSPLAPGSVNLTTGNRLTSVPLLSWPTRGGGSFNFTLFHNSQGGTDTGWGQNWRSNWDSRVLIDTGSPRYGNVTAILVTPTGSAIPFKGYLPAPGEIANTGQRTFKPPAGVRSVLVTHDGIINRWKLVSADGGVQEFNGKGWLVSSRDRHGNVTTLTRHNYDGRVMSITDSSGRTTSFTVAPVQAQSISRGYTTMTDPSGRLFKFRLFGSPHASEARLFDITLPQLVGHPDRKIGFAYHNGAIITESGLLGKPHRFEYDPQGRLLVARSAMAAPPLDTAWLGSELSHSTYFRYEGAQTIITDPSGRRTTYKFDNGLLRAILDSKNHATVLEYDRDLNVRSTKDPMGREWRGTYDLMGNLLTSQDSRQRAANKSETFTYSNANDLATSTDASGRTTTFDVNAQGDLVKVTEPGGRISLRASYDVFGDVVSITEPSSPSDLVTTITRNVHGLPTQVSDREGTETMLYDSLARLVRRTDADNRQSTVTRDTWGRSTLVLRSDGQTATAAYDLHGLPIWTENFLRKRTNFTFDADGNLIQKRTPAGSIERYSFDESGDLKSVYDANGRYRRYYYDERGLLKDMEHTDGTRDSFSYHPDGKLLSKLNGAGQRIAYAYDAAGDLATVDLPVGVDQSFLYDADGRPTQMSDATGVTTWTYDGEGRETLLSQPSGVVGTSYDAFGRRSGLTAANLFNLSYGYDGDRLTSIGRGDGTSAGWTFDAQGRLLTERGFNGGITSYTYDALDRLATLAVRNPGGVLIAQTTHGYDAMGRLTSLTRDGSATNYTYDDDGRLTRESAPGRLTAYVYDANGNRLSKSVNGSVETYAYGPGDRLLSVSRPGLSRNYAYDGAGRPVVINGTEGPQSFRWDAEDKLTWASGSLLNGTYAHNALGARGGLLRDGVAVDDDVLADAGASYVPGLAERRDGVWRALTTDRLGSVLSSASVARPTPGAFGERTSSPGSPAAWGHGWGYREEGALVQMGHRMYDPGTGRFLTRDPILDGGNHFAYVGNDPLNNVDPTGLLPVLVPLIWGLASALAAGIAHAPTSPSDQMTPERAGNIRGTLVLEALISAAVGVGISRIAAIAMIRAGNAAKLRQLVALRQLAKLQRESRTIHSGKLTHAGRAVTKHPKIWGHTSDTIRKFLNTDGSLNEAGRQMVRHCLRHGVKSYGRTSRGKLPFVEYRLQGGAGVRFNSQTGEWIGFVE